MTHRRRLSRHHLGATLLAAGVTAAGCSSVGDSLTPDKVDYRTEGAKTVSLDVPPDLSQLARDPRYQAAGGTLSAAALQGGAAPATPVVGLTSMVTPPNSQALRIERAGSQRWLVTSLSPEQVWPQLKAFWQDNGLALAADKPELGWMETEWTENRAKLPQDIIRRTVGRVFSNLYDSGQRDLYRTRVERNASGGTEVYITHRGREEIYVSEGKDQTRWQARAPDPDLEAVMLTRLMIKLGASTDVAKMAVAATGTAAAGATGAATSGAAATVRARAVSGRSDALQLDDGFDRAWRRVGVALDRTGFTVEDRDRTQGVYFVRYADPKYAGKEPPGFFARVFGGEKEFEPTARYRIAVKGEGNQSTVTVQDAQGGTANAELAGRIVELLIAELK